MTDSVQTDCIATACERPTFEIGYCRYHYSSLMKSGEIRRTRLKSCQCEAPDCELPAKSLRLCPTHRAQFGRHGHRDDFEFDVRKKEILAYGEYCSFETCEKPSLLRGLCSGHYGQFVKFGETKHINRGQVCIIPECQSRGGVRSNKFCTLHMRYRKKYGFTDEQVLSLFEERYCYNAGCGSVEKLNLDHDHDCCPYDRMCEKCVRGWLCWSCNIALGTLKEDVSRISGLADYISGGKRVLT